MTDLPLFRLDPSQTRFWHLNAGVRQLTANVVSKKYGDALILDDACYAIARVFRNATLELNHPPYSRRYEMWQTCNKPAPADCACRQYYDMEVEGEWRHRTLEQHHPMCIYERTSQVNHNYHVASFNHVKKIERPDTWLLKRDELAGSGIITSVRR